MYLVYLLLMAFSQVEMTILTDQEEDTKTDIGQGFYFPDQSLLADNVHGKNIFKELPNNCTPKYEDDTQEIDKTLYDNAADFYMDLAIDMKLEEFANGFTLGKSLEDASGCIDNAALNVKGIRLTSYRSYAFRQLTPDCLYDTAQFTDEFMTKYKQLPIVLSNPDSWQQYNDFLKEFGSHVSTIFKLGAKITHYVFALADEEITYKQLFIKACAPLKALIPDCGQFNDEDYNTVDGIRTSNKLFIRGGSAEKREALRKNITINNWEKLYEDRENKVQNINVRFKSLWELLSIKFENNKEESIKALILKQYYNGYLTTGCTNETIALRRFVDVNHDNNEIPRFECQIAQKGCRKNEDCNGDLSGCFCYGDSCIDRSITNDPRHTLQETAVVRHDKKGSNFEGVNQSCDYKVKDIRCLCNQNWGGEGGWDTVWPQEQTKACDKNTKNSVGEGGLDTVWHQEQKITFDKTTKNSVGEGGLDTVWHQEQKKTFDKTTKNWGGKGRKGDFHTAHTFKKAAMNKRTNNEMKKTLH